MCGRVALMVKQIRHTPLPTVYPYSCTGQGSISSIWKGLRL